MERLSKAKIQDKTFTRKIITLEVEFPDPIDNVKGKNPKLEFIILEVESLDTINNVEVKIQDKVL